MLKSIIKVENLTKKFGKKIILNNVNIEFKQGESVAILGNNGVGKSTFLRMLCGLTSISSGKIITDKNLKFNYIPDNYSKLNLTIEEYLECIRDLDKVNNDEFNIITTNLYKEFYLENMKDVPMKNLSKDTLQKVAVLQALITKPNVLLLDEPLSGQDINSQENFISIMKNLISQGVTIIMSCHETFLVEELSTRVLKIENKTITQAEMPKFEKFIYNFMVFESKKENRGQLQSILKDVEKYSEDDNLLKLEVKEN